MEVSFRAGGRINSIYIEKRKQNFSLFRKYFYNDFNVSNPILLFVSIYTQWNSIFYNKKSECLNFQVHLYIEF